MQVCNVLKNTTWTTSSCVKRRRNKLVSTINRKHKEKTKYKLNNVLYTYNLIVKN